MRLERELLLNEPPAPPDADADIKGIPFERSEPVKLIDPYTSRVFEEAFDVFDELEPMLMDAVYIVPELENVPTLEMAP